MSNERSGSAADWSSTLHEGIDAADAADAGQPSRTCPYELTREDLAQQFAAHWWIKCWRRRTEVLRGSDAE